MRRQQSRLGAPKAVTAAGHKIARIVYHLVRSGEAYVKRTKQHCAEQVLERQEKQLARRSRELGFEVTRVEEPAALTPER